MIVLCFVTLVVLSKTCADGNSTNIPSATEISTGSSLGTIKRYVDRIPNSSGQIPSKLSNSSRLISPRIYNDSSQSDMSLSGLRGSSNSRPSESGLDGTKQQTCCDVLPSICNDDGQCTLGMEICVKLCLCVTGIRDSWCQDILNSLAQESADTPETIQHTDLSPLVDEPPSNSTEPININLSPFKTEPLSNLTETANIDLSHFIAEPPTNSTKPANIDLSPLVAEPPSKTEPVDSVSMSSATLLNGTVMLGSDIVHTPTDGRHSLKSSHHIVGVPSSNNMPRLSAGESSLQTQADATNLTEQYRLPKQTHSYPVEAERSDLVMKQTTSNVTSDLLASDQNTHESPAHVDTRTVFRKKPSSDAASFIADPEQPTSKDFPSFLGSPELPTSKDFPSFLGSPELPTSEGFPSFLGTSELPTSKDFPSFLRSPELPTSVGFPSFLGSPELPTSNDFPSFLGSPELPTSNDFPTFLGSPELPTSAGFTSFLGSPELDKDLPSNTNNLFIPFPTPTPNENEMSLSSASEDDVKPHPCENCSGVCRLVFTPSYQLICEETEVDKCKNFDCGDHGTCIVSNSTGLVSCSCDDMYTGTFCENACDLDCGDDGKCGFINGSAICVCNWNNTGEFCEFLKTTESPRTIVLAGPPEPAPWHLIGVCLALLVVLVVVCVVLPYWSWRRRWLPMRKLVHYFQSYEDDDGKLYDAFVSYKSSKEDEYFVVHKLFPKLEKELDFKLCLHFRDFPPGETIADNIIRAIENSRRTILILSPSFVQSEWCRLEYQKAQQEMLKLKHKIIPIMLQDISKMADVDKNLKQIMNTVTFIEWPGDEETKLVNKFWQLMECSMPKKNSHAGGSERSLGSCSSQKPLTSPTESCCLDTLFDDVFPSSEWTSSDGSDEKNVNSKFCDEKVEKTTLFIENETKNSISRTNKNMIENEINKTNCNVQCNSTDNEATVSKSNSFSRSIHIVPEKSRSSNKRDNNLIQIQRLPGNKLKLWKITSDTSESDS